LALGFAKVEWAVGDFLFEQNFVRVTPTNEPVGDLTDSKPSDHFRNWRVQDLAGHCTL